MIVYSVSFYTATRSGFRLQPVQCMYCGQDYVYEMLRFATGTSVAIGVYFLESPSARRSADADASWELQKALAEGVDPVPCPQCGKLQPFMKKQVLDGQQVPIPGMPPPLVLIEQSAPDGGVYQQLVTGCPQQVSVRDNTVDLQMARIELPPACCLCMTPCHARYQAPLRISERDRPLRVPMCQDCRKELMRKNVLIGVGSWLGAASIGIVLAMLLLVINAGTFGAVSVGGMFTVLAGSIGMFFLPKLMVTPYTYKMVDYLRGIVRLSFQNPAYTALVAATAQASANSGQVFRNLMLEQEQNLQFVVDDVVDQVVDD